MFTKEMMKALEADGEKLRQLTGDDHGPWPKLQWVSCEHCGGSGEIIKNDSLSRDPINDYAEICHACEGTGRECVEASHA